MQRPILASTVLRQLSPRKFIGNPPSSFQTSKTVHHLRDESPYRPRSGSIKRKQSDQASYANVLTGQTIQVIQAPRQVSKETVKTNEEIEVEISKVSSICDKVGTTLASLEIDRNILGVFYDLNNAMRGIVRTQELLFKEKKEAESTVVDTAFPLPAPAPDKQVNMTVLVNIAKKPRQELSSQPPRQNTQVTQVSQEASAEQTKFRDAVKKAERSTLVFNLNMGNVPLMNQETIKTKATLALTTMAAKLEPGNNTSIPNDDTLASIDDVLSMVEDMEFYGRKTKPYFNSRDVNNGKFCTIPVRYEFPDKDAKFESEAILRDKCGAHCGTPYPSILRECIKQVTDKVKQDYPDSQVRVNVDTNNFSLRVSMKHKVEGTVNKWESYEKNIPLPKAALNVDARKVPDGFRMEFLPPNKEKGMQGSPEKYIRKDSVDSMDQQQAEAENANG
jgi:hypothetical protein